MSGQFVSELNNLFDEIWLIKILYKFYFINLLNCETYYSGPIIHALSTRNYMCYYYSNFNFTVDQIFAEIDVSVNKLTKLEKKFYLGEHFIPMLHPHALSLLDDFDKQFMKLLIEKLN